MPSEIQAFTDYIKFEKRYSAHTVRAYQDDLGQFFAYLEAEFGTLPVREISASFIRSWLASLKEKDMLSKSINRKISSLKSFFKWLVRTGRLDKSPMTAVISPKSGKRLPVYVEEQDMDTLINRVEFPNDWQGRTEKLLIQVFYQTGMRLSELIHLKNIQVDPGGSTLRVFGKGNKERIIPVGRELMENIRNYQKQKRETGRNTTETLLVNAEGKPLYVKYAYLAVRKWLSLVTTIGKKSPHVLRHSFATHLMNHGADLNAVKELLGHSSLAATQLYTHNSIEKLREVHKKSHPRG